MAQAGGSGGGAGRAGRRGAVVVSLPAPAGGVRLVGVAPERLLSVAHVAKRLGVSTKTIRRKIREGHFPRWQKLWGMVRVPEGDVAAVVDAERRRNHG